MLYYKEEVSNLLETFSTWNQCFTIAEVLEWSDEAINPASLRQAFYDDVRFLLLSQRGWGPECFLPERTMFRWWTKLNLRLAGIRQPRLTERQLTASLNSLRPDGLWFTPPVDILNYGQRFGFVSPAWAHGFFVFPLARLLETMSPRVAFDAFDSLENRDPVAKLPLSQAVDSILSRFGQRTSHVVKAREGLAPHRKMTLEELGTTYGCTRERIRQIESKFWKRIRSHNIKEQSFLLADLLAEIIPRQGSLVLDPGQEETAFVCFLAKCLGVPYVRTKVGSFVLLSYSESDRAELSPNSSVAEETDSDLVAEQLGCGALSGLGRNDLDRIAVAIAQDRYGKLNKQEKVYLALRHLGKPAHFSEVAETYNWLFPDDPTSDRNVHAILSRCAEPSAELHGIVWIGVKGTYALKEHGYERPSLGIFDAVRKVVKEKYEETQKPVHISVITTELGKYRQLVNPVSLAFATGTNPGLEQFSKDYFIPKEPQQETQPIDGASDLDRILREFREDHAGHS